MEQENTFYRGYIGIIFLCSLRTPSKFGKRPAGRCLSQIRLKSLQRRTSAQPQIVWEMKNEREIQWENDMQANA